MVPNGSPSAAVGPPGGRAGPAETKKTVVFTDYQLVEGFATIKETGDSTQQVIVKTAFKL